jgi:hypothetical protein
MSKDPKKNKPDSSDSINSKGEQENESSATLSRREEEFDVNQEIEKFSRTMLESRWDSQDSMYDQNSDLDDSE